MATDEEARKFGISVQLPDNDPMSASHLLGSDWVSTRWYASLEERDSAFKAMLDHPSYYRSGDIPSALLTKINP